MCIRDSLNPVIGDEQIVQRLNQELALTQQIQSVIHLGGTLDQPTHESSSDLGTSFANAINRITVGEATAKHQQYRKKLDEVLQAELATLDRQVQMNLDSLSKALGGEAAQIGRLKEQLPSFENRLRMR